MFILPSMFEALLPHLEFLKPYLPFIAITALTWITYGYTLRCGFVSDDIQGIGDYNGKLQGMEYGMISRWVRYHLCGGDFPSKFKVDVPNGKPMSIPMGKVPIRHHILSVTVFNLACISTYCFLSSMIGPKVALLAVLLFIVHPLVTQGVAWISGLGYPLSLLWITLGFNLTLFYYHIESPSAMVSMVVFLAFIILQMLAINALFIGLVSWVIFLFMGHYPFAILAGLISLMEGAKIVRSTIKLRSDEFKKQSMGHSTFLKPRKIIVATKTLLYYIAFTLFPKRMGLYHKWGYHYDASVERDDKFFLLGILVLGGLGTWFFLTPILAVKFGILWFAAFIFIFLNWITIQQFVTERYCMVPTLGTCIILAYFLQSFLPIYALILGLLLMRTWVHLPTYDNELKFYHSNVWNFDSEVAYGNLGVTYLRINKVGSALDSWQRAIEINPDYDVPYYNIYSHYRANAMPHLHSGNYPAALELMRAAYPYLEKCVNCVICHFKNDWAKELAELRAWIENPILMIAGEKKRLEELRETLNTRLKTATDPKDIEGIMISLRDIQPRMVQIEKILNENVVAGVPAQKPKA